VVANKGERRFAFRQRERIRISEAKKTLTFVPLRRHDAALR